jgi:archaellum biogenesis protein FlaJ (TadC family)
MTTLGEGTEASSAMGLQGMFNFSAPQIQFLETTTISMVFALALINAFAIVGSEGSHLIKMTYYLSILFIVSGLAFLVVSPMASMIA